MVAYLLPDPCIAISKPSDGSDIFHHKINEYPHPQWQVSAAAIHDVQVDIVAGVVLQAFDQAPAGQVFLDIP